MLMHIQTAAGIILSAALFLGAAARAQTPASSPGSALPADVYPDSRNRLPLPKREDMNEFGKKILDGLGAGQPLPATVHSTRLYSPVARSMEDSDHYVNFETTLPPQIVEIAILVTAREMNSQFEWTQNEPRARDPGNPHHIDPAIIDTIKYGKPATGLGEKERAVIAFGREMIGKRKVSSATFAEALRLFGRKETVDLVELIANYAAAALELGAFDQQLKAGQTPLLPARPKH
jgi:4-carboxymuconolactone decarboxylase